ncbi:hypothetical protein AZE42_13581 [Rhizopogon vesiculosus]|uniref:Uncharacterized protein n=1 Tax=Rhizopogon vesiculosus TaxID=180088 RepID=A0A1J8PX81_9AGAM|nr:hypothetical protein AZE42_13581 [Rhizopogon vesiculosus]
MEGSSTVPINAHLMLPTVAEHHVVHILAKTPAYPWQSVQHVITAHGATMFLPALRLFLREHMPHNNIVPGSQDHFDIFRQVIIVAPPDPHRSANHQGGGALEQHLNDSIRTLSLRTLEGVRVGRVRVTFTLPRQFGTYS